MNNQVIFQILVNFMVQYRMCKQFNSNKIYIFHYKLNNPLLTIKMRQNNQQDIYINQKLVLIRLSLYKKCKIRNSNNLYILFNILMAFNSHQIILFLKYILKDIHILILLFLKKVFHLYLYRIDNYLLYLSMRYNQSCIFDNLKKFHHHKNQQDIHNFKFLILNTISLNLLCRYYNQQMSYIQDNYLSISHII